MNLSLRPVCDSVLWLGTFILCSLPLIMALDFGGYLHWTQWLAAVSVLAVAVLALFGQALGQNRKIRGILPSLPWRCHRLFFVMTAWSLFAWFQVLELPISIASWLSPGSQHAYFDWAGQFSALPDSMPISISSADSTHAACMLLIVTLVVWASPNLFSSRKRIGALLSIVAVSGAVIAVIGIGRMMFGGFHLWSFREGGEGSPFGTFINRNNAALFMNLGFACSLGIMAWRLSAVHDQELDVDGFQLSDLLSLVGDRASMLAMISGIACLVGLLLCRSRAGAAAMIIGALLAFGWVRQRRGFYAAMVVLGGIGIAVIVLAMPSGMRADAIERFKSSFDDNQAAAVIADARLMHWPDGWRAGLEYLPAGSGLSTYSYAYLPYQETSPWRWYHHADNLWLELFVEQGLFGIAFAIAIFAFVINALLRMAYSHDSMDEGLRITGWFFIGTILASQTFDFGLIAPANLLIVAAFLPVLMVRGGVVPRFTPPLEERSEQPIVPTRQKVVSICKSQIRVNQVVAAMGFGLLLIVGLVSIPRLGQDAQNQHLANSAELTLSGIETNAQELSQWISDLESAIAEKPSAELYQQLSNYQYQLARLYEVAESNPASEEIANRLYRETSRNVRRLKFRAGTDKLVSTTKRDKSEALRLYTSSLQTTNASLRSVPLALGPRMSLLQLEFVHRDKTRSSEAIVQASRLYRNSPKLLFDLAVCAAENGDLEQATEMWRRTLQLDAQLTIRVINAVTPYDISVDSVIPDRTRNYRIAADYLLRTKADEPVLYKRMLDRLPCEFSADPKERANCYTMLGELAMALDRYPLAIKHFRQATESEPLNNHRSWQLVNALHKSGQLAEALKTARKGTEVYVNDKRFKDFVSLHSNKMRRELP